MLNSDLETYTRNHHEIMRSSFDSSGPDERIYVLCAQKNLGKLQSLESIRQAYDELKRRWNEGESLILGTSYNLLRTSGDLEKVSWE